MRTLLRILKYALLAIVVLVAGVLAIAYWRSGVAMARVYDLPAAQLTLDGSAPQLERGRHLAVTRGCTECHGENLGGRVVFEAPPMGRYVASNITPGGTLRLYDDAQLERAIRHGVGFDGTPLVFMPANDFAGLSDADVAALIAYLRSVPAVRAALPELEVGPLARVLWLFGAFPLLPAENVAHDPGPRTAPVAAVTAEYGRYVAQSCTGCHGEDFAGGPLAGAPPSLPPPTNLTPHPTGLAAWSEEDFIVAMRQGKRPDGSAIDPFMPWKNFGQMDDTELKAVWAYLRSLPPKPEG